MGRTLVDQKDTFGRTTRHTDLSGRLYTYAYNQDGWLTDQASSAGQSIHTDYYANGYVKRITDNALNTRTDYEYDNNGNRTYEAYQRTVNGTTEYLQNSSITYDELNRVSQVTDPRATIRYEYDAVGNRRHVWSYYNNGLDGNVSTQDYWYSFDSMNRFTVTMGQLSTGARATSANDTSVSIVAGASGSGVSLSYNLAGERKSATYANDGHTESYDFDATGHLSHCHGCCTGFNRRRNHHVVGAAWLLTMQSRRGLAAGTPCRPGAPHFHVERLLVRRVTGCRRSATAGHMLTLMIRTQPISDIHRISAPQRERSVDSEHATCKACR